VVSGKQHQQNKGDDSGLQETAEGAAPYPHRRDSSGEGGKFLGEHITDKLKWSNHRQCGEEGATAPQPQEAEEMWLVTPNPDKPLQMHNQEHPVGLYHSLVQQLHRTQPQGSP
jgi:hypothetical protein